MSAEQKRVEATPTGVAPSVPVLEASGVSKSYASATQGGLSLLLFRDLSLRVHRGEMVSIVGRSGSGKSSLLHLLAGLDRPTAGVIRLGTQRLTDMPEAQLAAVRNRYVGFVWQFHYLLPEFSALENVALPLLARGERRSAALARAGAWLERVGLATRGEHRSGELSGGEQQRVAVARALITEPSVLLADEPTGDLDDETAALVFDLLHGLVREQRLATVLVTHNAELAQRCDRQLRLVDGCLEPVG